MGTTAARSRSPLRIAFLLIFPLVLAGAPGCVERKMSVREARDVAVSMSAKTFDPPPAAHQRHPFGPRPAGRDP